MPDVFEDSIARKLSHEEKERGKTFTKEIKEKNESQDGPVGTDDKNESLLYHRMRFEGKIPHKKWTYYYSY